MSISHVRELFDYNRWANRRLLDVATSIDDAGLDREFAIGFGTLRKTINHLYAVERIWHERHDGPGYDEPRPWEEITAVADMRAALEALHAARDEWLTSLPDGELSRPVAYTDLRGEHHTNTLGDILQHVCDHGAHHRAQAANITRHIGTPFKHVDYLYFRLAEPTLRLPNDETSAFLRNAGLEIGARLCPPRPLSVARLRDAFDYNDWANRSIVNASKALSDAQLDRPFEMGMGTLRKTIIHLEGAERFWLDNWCGADCPAWKQLEDTTPPAEVGRALSSHRARRSELLDGLNDAALLKEISAAPAPGKVLYFRLGETMLQIGFHGTHHRAQALNMLRHVAGSQLRIDFITFKRAPRAEATTETT